MKKTTLSFITALSFCFFTSVGDNALVYRTRSLSAEKGCIASFFTVAAGSNKSDETSAPVLREEKIEYGFKLYEVLKKIFG